MLTLILLFIPLTAIVAVSSNMQYGIRTLEEAQTTYIMSNYSPSTYKLHLRTTAIWASVITLLITLIMFMLYDSSCNYFQFTLFNIDVTYLNFSLGLDGSSVYFILLTSIIIPISLTSNWVSISENLKLFLVSILLLEILLLSVFLGLDGILYYVYFESILPPLFIIIGAFGSINKVRASFYLFLYTLLGSLFMLLAILVMSSLAGFTDFDALYKTSIILNTQLLLFFGIFFAFAVKTPTTFLNSWLLKAHVESPLSGSIILAGIVLKLSLYGVFRLILPLLAKAYIISTFSVYMIGFITILYASLSTIRTVDVKELIAYSSVCHAAVYLMGALSNSISGIEGAILLGLAHGFVSSGLFICAGGILYDRSTTRCMVYYRGVAQLMPIFSIVFFILCLGNCGVPLTFNFIGEFMSLYGILERHILFGALASSSIILSAAYTIYMFNRTAFSGSYSKYFITNIPDVNKREFYMLLTLVIFSVIFGVYSAPILDGIHYSISTLIYSSSSLLYIVPLMLKNTQKSVFANANLRFIYYINPISEIIHIVILYMLSFKLVSNNLPSPHSFVNLHLQSIIGAKAKRRTNLPIKRFGNGKRNLLSTTMATGTFGVGIYVGILCIFPLTVVNIIFVSRFGTTFGLMPNDGGGALPGDIGVQPLPLGNVDPFAPSLPEMNTGNDFWHQFGENLLNLKNKIINDMQFTPEGDFDREKTLQDLKRVKQLLQQLLEMFNDHTHLIEECIMGKYEEMGIQPRTSTIFGQDALWVLKEDLAQYATDAKAELPALIYAVSCLINVVTIAPVEDFSPVFVDVIAKIGELTYKSNEGSCHLYWSGIGEIEYQADHVQYKRDYMLY